MPSIFPLDSPSVHGSSGEFPENRQQKNTKSKKQSIKDLLNEFTETTTLHGINRVSLTTGIIRKVVWSIVFLACTGYAVYMTYRSIACYLEGNTSTSITVVKEQELPFPSVTICNLNTIKHSKLENLLNSQNQTGEEKDHAYHNAVKMNNPYSVGKDHNTTEKDNQISGKDLSMYFDLLTHTSEKMLVTTRESRGGCVFKEQIKCNHTDFKPINLRIGRCYTFNSDQKNRLGTDQTGRKGGLKLFLNVEEYEYISSSFPGAGFKVLIHEPGEFPNVEDLGFGVQPGAHVLAAITKNINKRLPKNDQENKNKESLKYLKGYSYTESACMQNCEIQEMVRKCGCVPYYIEYDSLPICNFTEYYGCCSSTLREVSSLKKAKDCRKSCPPETSSIKYDVQLSFTSIPNNPTIELVMNDLPELNTTDRNVVKQFIRDNFVQLDIYYKELKYMKIEEIPAMNIMDLVGNIGGNSGLWLGMSILTILELLDLLVKILATVLTN